MNLLSKSAWIFVGILFLLLVAAIYPVPAIIGITTVISTALLIFQAVIILKDEG